MGDSRKAKIEQSANRIASWLADNRATFEEQGIDEDALAGAADFGEVEEVRLAVDYLENREVVVRWPQALTRPPRFLLKPGRNWPEMRDKLLGTQAAGGTK
jgi:hypothetical protein